MEIKNIIFDLGNVILNIDPLLTAKAFRKIGYTDFNLQALGKEEKKLLNRLETGTVSPEEFRNHIRKYINKDLSDKIIDEAWNAMLLDLPAERLELLEKLRTKYRLFLLSNTNAIHLECISNYLKKTYAISNLSSFFEKEYYSHQVNCRKPDPEIFNLLLKAEKLKADETLFIDDAEENIAGARKLKINTYHLQPASESILDIDVFN